MSSDGYTVEVTSISPFATEKDVYDFFAFSGKIEHIEFIRYGHDACTAYVTFKDAHALETALLLSGATIADQRVCITRWGHHEEETDFWNRPSWSIEDEISSNDSGPRDNYMPNAGEAVSMAQEVVKTMASKGYVLGKDALTMAKSFDQSHQVSATAAAKVAELSERIGLVDKIFAGMEAVRTADQKYHVSESTKMAASAAGRTAATAATNVVGSSYFSQGALWMSDALNRAAKVAADLGTQGIKK